MLRPLLVPVVPAGRPSRAAVISVFTKAGYALSWVARAERRWGSRQSGCARSSRPTPTA